MGMNKSKKTLAKVFALSMALTLAFATGCGGKGESESEKEEAFIAQLGGVSETYTGTVSVESYNTAENAAEAFVKEEVVGEADVNVVNTQSKGELTEEQITALNLPEDVQDGIVSVEEMEVEYSESTIASVAAGSETYNPNKTVKVYVIKYATEWKYYSPAPITGETITKSYYDSVFNYEKYTNCTMSMTMDMKISVTAKYQGQTQTSKVSSKMTQLVKYDDNKIYLEQTTKMTAYGESYTEAIYAYMEIVDGEIDCYVKIDDGTEISTEWGNGDLETIGFDSLEELTPFYDQYLDYTYFTKTDYGFAISDENAKQYINETLAQQDDMSEMMEYLEAMDIDMFVKYYISEGVLSGMREDATMKINMSEDGLKINMKADIVAEVSCTNYGTTVVEKPFTE